jgi:hypothetical protein
LTAKKMAHTRGAIDAGRRENGMESEDEFIVIDPEIKTRVAPSRRLLFADSRSLDKEDLHITASSQNPELARRTCDERH